MKNLCLIVLLLFTLPAVAADKVYKKVNPDGSVEYSDQPFEGGEEMPVQQAPAMKFEKSPRIDFHTSTRRDRDDEAPYQVAITAPANNESIRDNTGNVSLQGEVQPHLRGGHQLRWVLDGEPLDEIGTTVQLDNVDRGSHTVKLEVVDNDGEVLAASPGVTFHLMRRSITPSAPPSNSQPSPLNPPKPVIPGPTPTNPPKPSPPSSSP